MVIPVRNRVTLAFIAIFLTITTTFALPAPQFSSGEHLVIGDNINLFFSAKDPGKTHIKLHLENGLSLSYGEIVTLGDFYGDPDEPISQGRTIGERRRRFMSAFNAFAQPTEAIQEVTELMKVAHTEISLIEDALEHGESTDEVYKRIGDDHDRQYNCLTG